MPRNRSWVMSATRACTLASGKLRAFATRGTWHSGAAVEILVVRKVLANELGADHRAVPLYQATVSLVRKDELREPGHAERVDEAGDCRHNNDHHDGGANLSQHWI